MNHPIATNTNVYYLKLLKYSNDKGVKCQWCKMLLNKVKGTHWDRTSINKIPCITKDINGFSINNPYHSFWPWSPNINSRKIVIIKSKIINSREINSHNGDIKYEYTLDGIKKKCIFPRDKNKVFITQNAAQKRLDEINEVMDLEKIMKSIYEKRRKNISSYCFDVRSDVILI